MLDAAQEGGYAYPAINITSVTTINGALKAFAESGSDGIIQVSTGGGSFASGTAVADEAFGAIVLAEATHRLAEKYDVLVALHTDHCHPQKVDSFLKPLLQASRYSPSALSLISSLKSKPVVLVEKKTDMIPPASLLKNSTPLQRT